MKRWCSSPVQTRRGFLERLRLAAPSSRSEPLSSRLLWLATLGRLPLLGALDRLPWLAALRRPADCAAPSWLSDPLPLAAEGMRGGPVSGLPGLDASCVELGTLGGRRAGSWLASAAADACTAAGSRPTACRVLAETRGGGLGRLDAGCVKVSGPAPPGAAALSSTVKGQSLALAGPEPAQSSGAFRPGPALIQDRGDTEEGSHPPRVEAGQRWAAARPA